MGALVCAAAIDAASNMQGRTVHFFITPPQVLQPLDLSIVALTLDHEDGRDNMRQGQGTSEDKGTAGFRQAASGGVSIPHFGKAGFGHLSWQFFSKLATTLASFHHQGCQIQNALGGVLRAYTAGVNVRDQVPVGVGV